MSHVHRAALATAALAVPLAIPFVLAPVVHADAPQPYYKCSSGPFPGPGFTVDRLFPVIKGSGCRINPLGAKNSIGFTSKRAPVYTCASIQHPSELQMVMGQSCKRHT
ncbi:hypothetical protein [Streptosporangium lutulentum]|uniref:Secreted protein n=1 Tax=Streptosporangium lutulentum TaxID=1461250 RepID=A0ABT9QBH8_9ACTN|nr:hypothetical protein [Streptosporangium lutulentum]MDP9844127.1 hypothetical protein [Streptosporangium lutulentum]